MVDAAAEVYSVAYKVTAFGLGVDGLVPGDGKSSSVHTPL